MTSAKLLYLIYLFALKNIANNHSMMNWVTDLKVILHCIVKVFLRRTHSVYWLYSCIAGECFGKSNVLIQKCAQVLVTKNISLLIYYWSLFLFKKFLQYVQALTCVYLALMFFLIPWNSSVFLWKTMLKLSSDCFIGYKSMTEKYEIITLIVNNKESHAMVFVLVSSTNKIVLFLNLNCTCLSIGRTSIGIVTWFLDACGSQNNGCVFCVCLTFVIWPKICVFIIDYGNNQVCMYSLCQCTV